MGLYKIFKIVALVFSILSGIFFLMILSKGDSAIVESLGAGEDVASIDYALYMAYLIFALVLATVVIFAVKDIAAGNIKKTLFTIGAFLLIVVVSYGLSSGADVDTLPKVDGVPISESGSRWVGAGLYTFYALGLVAIGTMLYTGITKIKR